MKFTKQGVRDLSSLLGKKKPKINLPPAQFPELYDDEDVEQEYTTNKRR